MICRIFFSRRRVSRLRTNTRRANSILTIEGLGNPQESEFTLVLRDGLPLMSDWIGFPTLYYLPLPQSISEIQFIRGGNSLLYGPEPAPAVNFITKHPEPGSPWNFYTEQIGGALRILFHLQCDPGGYGSVGISFRWRVRAIRRTTG